MHLYWSVKLTVPNAGFTIAAEKSPFHVEECSGNRPDGLNSRHPALSGELHSGHASFPSDRAHTLIAGRALDPAGVQRTQSSLRERSPSAGSRLDLSSHAGLRTIAAQLRPHGGR